VRCAAKASRGADIEIEIEFNRHGATPGLDRYHLHVRCFAAWERRARCRPYGARARAESVWYRTAGLATRNRKDLAVDIIDSEIRSAMHEVWLEASKLVLTDNEPIAIARHLRDLAERTIRPK
jgi:hypothetical protein